MNQTKQPSKPNRIQAVRGMNDLLPTETPRWQEIENTLKQIAYRYGYNEIRTPIIESTGLFKRAVGEVTDIVEKEMYTFNDRNNESITLRPELTAGGVRAGIEQGLLYNQEQRFWYLGPAFRYERPQKGRYRQFQQFGVEVFGLPGPEIEAELIFMASKLWHALSLEKHVMLHLNSIGSVEERAKYRQALVKFLELHDEKLDEDCKRRLKTNPLRILDSKNPQIQILLDDAPQLVDYLNDDSKDHFNRLCKLIDAAGINYTINPRLVRGLDYYNHTVFEWITSSLGAQGTVCAGGRYDGLVAQLGGHATPAIGFAIGIERLVLLAQTIRPNCQPDSQLDIYVIYQSELQNITVLASIAQRLADLLRDAKPLLRIRTDYGTSNLKKQLSRADKLGARLAVVVGEKEAQENTALIKNLQTGEQTVINQNQIVLTCLMLLGKIKGESS